MMRPRQSWFALDSDSVHAPPYWTGPDAPPVRPASFVVSNKGAAGTYAKKRNAVSVPIGAAISVSSISELGTTITVNGTGFSPLTAINFFNAQPSGVVNLGGLKSDGSPIIPLMIVNDMQFTFNVPAGAVPSPILCAGSQPAIRAVFQQRDRSGRRVYFEIGWFAAADASKARRWALKWPFRRAAVSIPTPRCCRRTHGGA